MKKTDLAPISTNVLSAVAPAAPKMMASATVRLYRLNTATNGYEAHAGGQALGLVVMGTL